MELLELKNKFLSILETDMENFSGRISAVLSDSNTREKIFSQYVELVDGDLETDNLQKIWQYYHADRKEKCQDYTPKSIARLLSALTETSGLVCYDLCAGSGALTISKWTLNKNKIFICEELDKRVFPVLLFNMAVRNMEGYAICRNSLTLEFFECYKLTKGKRFSEITSITAPPEIEADEIISNPPYNIKWEPPPPLFADSRFQKCEIPPETNANWAFVLTALNRLSDFGKCAFVLPCGFLSKDNEVDQRRWATQNRLIKKIITLPDGMFESTSIPTCVLLFAKDSESVDFYDARKSGHKEERLQNGQFGGASHQNRTYKKEVNALSDDIINQLKASPTECPGFSTKKFLEDVSENQWNWIPSRYIPLPFTEILHRNYSDIMADINRVSRERSAIKLTINESLAKQLGLYEIAEIEKETAFENLNQTFRILGGEYISKPYITLSKNKNEIKFEANDKEILSSIFSILIPMWKQHVFYLNQEENNLLAELRDAMIPDLMSGKISLE